MNRKAHWENIYNTKELTEVSWYQEVPSTAIEYLRDLKVSKDDAIIDVGGGDSFFVDYLIQNDYQNITVLDISAAALNRAKQRLGDKAHNVNWIVADASNYKSDKSYDFWYDRAAFHFLTAEQDIRSYVNLLEQSISPKGQVVIGTFSKEGPTKCSGIDIMQYSAKSLEEVFHGNLICYSCQKNDHITPFNTIQHFTFCSFKRR